MKAKNTATSLTPVQSRMQSSHARIILDSGTINEAVFQHSILCQTFLPYRNPGDENIIWTHSQGDVHLAVQCTQQLDPETSKWVFCGLPYGPKSRLILTHISSEAIRRQSPVLHLESSMTGFIKRMGISVEGRSINEVKNQLRRLVSCTFSMGYIKSGSGTLQKNIPLLDGFDIWFPKDENQRVLWQSTIQLSDQYFTSLLKHAIPLDHRALASLSHNAMALDIYAWLAQRLHRIDPSKPQFVPWKNVKEQFGQNYAHMYKFKQVFRKTLKLALLQYPQAKINEDKNKGFYLYQSPTPITRKIFTVLGK